MKRYTQTEIEQMRFIAIPEIAAIRQEIEARAAEWPQPHGETRNPEAAP